VLVKTKILLVLAPILVSVVSAQATAYDYTVYAGAGCRPAAGGFDDFDWIINMQYTYNNAGPGSNLLPFNCPIVRQNVASEPWLEIDLRVRDGNPGTDTYDAVRIWTGVYNHSNLQGTGKIPGVYGGNWRLRD
jgi:hypothetical protein